MAGAWDTIKKGLGAAKQFITTGSYPINDNTTNATNATKPKYIKNIDELTPEEVSSLFYENGRVHKNADEVINKMKNFKRADGTTFDPRAYENKLFKDSIGGRINYLNNASSGTQEVNPYRSASKMADTSLGGQQKIAQLSDEADRIGIKPNTPETQAEMDAKRNEIQEATEDAQNKIDHPQDNGGYDNVTQDNNIPIKIDPENTTKLSEQQNDYFNNNLTDTWNSMGKNDQRILLFDQLGTMLRNNSKYRPRLVGAFGDVRDEGQDVGNERSLAEQTLQNALQAGLDRRNTRYMTTLTNALNNIQMNADLRKQLLAGYQSGDISRRNMDAMIKYIGSLDEQHRRDIKNYTDILKMMGPHQYGINTPYGGVSYTSPGAQLPQ